MLKIAICDDEKIALEKMEKILWKCLDEIKLEWKSYLSGKALFEDLKKGAKFDLMFLDIEMKELSGIEFANILRNELDDYATQIVFVTNKENYAKAACKVCPLDFIDKPFGEEHILTAINNTIKVLGDNKRYFSYSSNKEKGQIPLTDIYYFKSNGRKIEIKTKNQTITFNSRLKDIDKELESRGFIKAHKSYIINTKHISKLKPHSIVMVDEEEISISETAKKILSSK